jgi:secondary thiamine-phosphate synthase enzyme
MEIITPTDTRAALVNDCHTNQGQMKICSKTITVPTNERTDLIKLTDELRTLVNAASISDGFMQISSLHTTAALFVNEWQEALLHDIREMYERVMPRALYYRHNDPVFSDCERKNADSHLSAIIMSHSLSIPIAEGRLMLGQWQHVIMAEFDGPNQRRVFLQVIGI